MEHFYFMIRAGLVLAALAGGAFWIGTIVGRQFWRGEGNRLEEIENQNQKLEAERDSLRDPGLRASIPEI